MIAPTAGPVVERAIEIISAQSAVPMSPAGQDETGAPILCYAAAVAKAGFLAQGKAARADTLTRELIRTGSKDVLALAYLELGWTQEDCRSRLDRNDGTAPTQRKEVVLQLLRSTASA